MNQHRKLDALDALANDPEATEAERELARAHADRVRAALGGRPDVGYDDSEVEVPVDQDLIDALDRAMARAATVRSHRFRAARIRAAQHRIGRTATKQWYDGRGPRLPR